MEIAFCLMSVNQRMFMKGSSSTLHFYCIMIAFNIQYYNLRYYEPYKTRCLGLNNATNWCDF